MKFGILGDAKISRTHLIPAMQLANCSVIHIGTRSPDQKSNQDLYKNIAIGSYEDVLGNPDVEAVYIPLPNHLHAQWSIKALEAGKHVLCEKPMALSMHEIDLVEAAAEKSGCYFYEGFMVRSHPQWKWLQSLDIGGAQHISTFFSYPPQPDGNVRNYAEMGGGPIWDIGCYTILAGLMIFDSEPTLISSDLQMESKLDVEKSANAILDFGDGRRLSMGVSSAIGLSQSLHLVGSDGWARLNTPFNPPEVTSARWAKGSLGEGTLVEFPACNHYALMLEDFVKSCRTGGTPDYTYSRYLINILSEIISHRD